MMDDNAGVTRAPVILVVGDTAEHLGRLRHSLLSICGVVEAADEGECLRALTESRFDVVILNHAPDHEPSTLETLRSIAGTEPGTPVLFVTDSGNEDLAVQAMKAGAADYVRKTLSGDHIERVVDNVRYAVESGDSDQAKSVKRSVLRYFEEHRQQFLNRWRQQMNLEKERIGLDGALPIDEINIERLFSAFLEDIENDRSAETLLFLRSLIALDNPEERSLVAVELINICFKNVARQMLMERYPDSFDSRALLMGRIAMIVDENDLQLSKEYERLLGAAIEKMRASDQLATKSKILTTLQHEIRQSLSYVLNTSEMLLRDRTSVSDDAIRQIMDQIRRVEGLLAQLERDSHMKTRRYSANLQMIDVNKGEQHGTGTHTSS